MPAHPRVVVALACFAIAATARADDIRLSTGEVLHVTILEQTPTTVRFVHPVLGEVTLPRGAVEIIAAGEATAATHVPSTAPAATSPVMETTAASAASPTPIEDNINAVPASQPEPPPREWRFRLVLAAADASGNTDTASVSTLFTATRDTPQLRTALDASYFYARSDGETSENRFSTGFRHDWLNPGSVWFSFINGRFDYDEFQSWRYRAQGHVGVGYHLITPPKLRLDLLAGVGALKEWDSDNEGLRPEGLFGLDGEYQIADRHTLRFTSTYFPDLSDFSIYRWVNSAAWSWTIDTRSSLALTAGVQQEYQSQVDPGTDHNDLRIYAGVQLDF